MHNLNERIRQARAGSRISQTALANRVGVQRSAVAQWERRGGTHPSMDHLAGIAVATGVCLEWLGTGRGPTLPDETEWAASVNATEYVQDGLEAECLEALRKLPISIRKQVAAMISLLSNNYR